MFDVLDYSHCGSISISELRRARREAEGMAARRRGTLLRPTSLVWLGSSSLLGGAALATIADQLALGFGGTAITFDSLAEREVSSGSLLAPELVQV